MSDDFMISFRLITTTILIIIIIKKSTPAIVLIIVKHMRDTTTKNALHMPLGFFIISLNST